MLASVEMVSFVVIVPSKSRIMWVEGKEGSMVFWFMLPKVVFDKERGRIAEMRRVGLNDFIGWREAWR